ncbi:MAG TPA: hypothetical protein VFV17_10845 [Usitatibacteraceae bacterium]|nr:hypothetical protein [Usitatibacteraceae bacterium]
MNRRTALSILLAALPAVAGASRLAQVEIYDRTAQRSLPIHWHAGQAYVEGRPGNEYQIVVRNQTAEDVLAVVSVDGVNVVTGQTASPQQGGYVLDGWRRLDVSGWRKSLSRTAAFYFTELPDSYAARTGRPDDIGVIGVALFRRKPLPPPPVYVEPEVQAFPQSAPREKSESRSYDRSERKMHERSDAAPQAAAPQLGTGHGRGETNYARRVEFERATPYPEEVITIRYDRRENLVAMGVIRESRHAWRQPRAFPGGFVADPPPRW